MVSFAVSTFPLCAWRKKPLNVALGGIFPYIWYNSDGSPIGAEVEILKLWGTFSKLDLNIIGYTKFDQAINDVS